GPDGEAGGAFAFCSDTAGTAAGRSPALEEDPACNAELLAGTGVVPAKDTDAAAAAGAGVEDVAGVSGGVVARGGGGGGGTMSVGANDTMRKQAMTNPAYSSGASDNSCRLCTATE